MNDDDHTEPDAQERAEAAALAELLEGRRAEASLAEDASEVAALLRYGGVDGELDAERAKAICDELLARGLPRDPAVSAHTRGFRWRFAFGAAVLAATAVVLALRPMLGSEPRASVASHPASAPATPGAARADLPRRLPPPPPALLSAQLEAAQAPGDRRVLQAETRRYRERVLRGLEARYPATVGVLDTTRGRR